MNNPNDTVDAALQQAETVIDESLQPMAEHVLDGVRDAVERLADIALQAVDRLEQSGEYLKVTQDKAMRGARSYVRDQPMTAIGFAVAGGFLLSWALRQR